MGKYYFHLEGSGLGTTTWRVSGAGEITRLETRYEATDYQRSISSLTDLEWQHDVIASIGLLHVASSSSRAIPQDLVDEFNAWRLAEYERHRAHIDANPERYGVIDW